MKADAEWGKLGQVPGLVDGWTDVKDKVGIATEEFKARHHDAPCLAALCLSIASELLVRPC